jgi:DivIVA domain-containing protein
VALDRQSIARRDFPTNRRGYDPAAVDAHLQAVADEVVALERRASSAPPLSAQAGTQVAAIIEAAERSAEEIRAGAERESAERIAHATTAADELRARIERLDEEITALVAGLRDGARRLHDELAAAQVRAGDLAGRGVEPTPEAPVAQTPVGAPVPAPDAEEAAPIQPAGEVVEPAASLPPTGADGDDTEAARIVALNMALSGDAREAVDRYLAEHYELDDREALLDEVYAAAGA